MALNANIGSAWISITSDTRSIAPSVTKAMEKAEKSISGNGIGKKLASGIGKTLKVGAATAGVAVGGILATSMAKGMGRLQSLENAQAKLRGLGNDAESVTEIMDNALASVKGTSFGMGEAATTAAGAVAAGIKPGKELEGVLKSVANSASATGRGMDEMGSIFNKVATSGKAQNDVLQQVADSGLPIYQTLADQFGVTTDEVTKMASAGEIGFAEFEQAMKSAAGTVAEEMGKTTQGTIENLGSAMGRFGEKMQAPIFAAAPSLFGAFTTVFDEMTDAVGPVSESIGETLTPKLEAFATLISDKFAPAMGEAVEWAGKWVEKGVDFVLDPESWTHIADIFGKVRDTVVELWPSIKSLAGSFLTISQSVSVATWEALTSVLDALAPVVESVLVPLLEKVAEFAEENPETIEKLVWAFLAFKGVGAVAGPVGTATKTLGNLGGAVSGVSKAFKGATFGQGLLTLMGGAKSANPILAKLGTVVGSVFKVFWKLMPILAKVGKVFMTVIRFVNPWVAGISLVVGALTWFFTQTETGQAIVETVFTAIKDAWNWVVEAVSSGWENYIKPALEAFWRIAQNTIAVIGTLILAPLLIAWNLLSAGIKAAWEGLIKPAWDAFSSAISTLWNTYAKPIFSAISSAWDVMSSVMSATWQVIKTAVFDAWNTYVNRVKANWDLVTGLLSAAWQVVSDRFTAIWGWIRDNVFQPMMNKISELWNAYASPIFQWVGDKWNWLRDMFVAGWHFIRDQAFAKLQDGLSNLKNFVSNIVDGIKSVWDNLRGHFARPINFMIDAVWNNGVLKAWETMRKILPNLKEGTPAAKIPGYAAGGAIQKNPTGRISGPGTGTSDSILARIANGEHMWTAAEVKALGSHEQMYRLRALIRNKIPFTTDGSGHFQPLPRGIDNSLGDLAGAAPDLLPKFRDGGEIKPAWESQLEAAHRFAKAQHGKPYQWAGPTGPGSSFDCSGFMGSIAATIQNTNPWQRYWATGSFPSPGAQGFAPGLGQGFSIGVWNGGPYGGHTSGTLSKAGGFGTTNVESGGSPSMVKYGIGAAGADSPQHKMHFHLPIGADGSFESGGVGGFFDFLGGIKNWVKEQFGKIFDPIKDKLPSPPPEWLGIPGAGFNAGKDALTDSITEKVESLGDLTSAVWAKITDFDFGIFDTGGVLKPGGVAMNLSGKPEIVINNAQLTAISRLANNVGRLVQELSVGKTNGLAYQAVADDMEAILANVTAFVKSASMSDWLKIADSVGLGNATKYISGSVTAFESLQGTYADQMKAANDVAGAELKLGDARKALAAIQAGGEGDAVEAAKAVSEAESGLADARGVASSVAMSAGRAEIALAIEIAGAVWDLGNAINEFFISFHIHANQLKVQSMGAIREWMVLVDNQRQKVSELQTQMVADQIALVAANWKVRTSQADVVRAQLEGVKSVADAEAKLDAERERVQRNALLDYSDLSLAYDRYRWAQKVGMNELVGDVVAVTPELLALQHEVHAARMNAEASYRQAAWDSLEAVWAQEDAARSLLTTQLDLQKNMLKLEEMGKTAFGFTTKEATVLEKVLEYSQDNAELMGKRDALDSRFRGFFGGAGKMVGWDNAWSKEQEGYASNIRANNEMIAELLKLEGLEFSDAALKEFDKAINRAAEQYAAGRKEAGDAIIAGSEIGKALLAADLVDTKNRLDEIDQREDNIKNAIEQGERDAARDAERQKYREEIAALREGGASQQYYADAQRETSEATKEALLALGDWTAANAEAIKNREPVNIALSMPYKESYSRDEMDLVNDAFGEIDDINLRVERLETPDKPGARELIDSRRRK